jgi:tRNA nucleotidyltransferase/poly(A) polymerase
MVIQMVTENNSESECMINDLFRNVLTLSFYDFIVNSESFTQRIYFQYLRKLSDPHMTPNPVYYHQYKIYEKYFPEIRLMVDANAFPKSELQSYVYRNFDTLLLKLHWLNFAHVHTTPTIHFIFEKFPHKLVANVIRQTYELISTNEYDFVTDDVLTLIMKWCNIATMTQKVKTAEILYNDLNQPEVANNPLAVKQIQKQLRKLFKINGYDGTETIDEFMLKQIDKKMKQIKNKIIVSF